VSILSDQGQRLGKEIVKWQYNYVHFITHSAGSHLIHEAAKHIKTNDRTPPFIHSTFLDAYCPNSDETIYAYYSDFAEHYVDRGFPFTDADLWGAYNFDVTYLPKPPLTFPSTPFLNGWSNEIWQQYHFWPVDWYQQSIKLPSVYRFGFSLSFEANKNPDVSSYYSGLENTFLKPNFPGGPGGSCKMDSETLCSVEHDLAKPIILAYHNPSKYSVNFIASKVSPTGTVELYADNGILKTGSPVWFEAPLTTTQSFNLIKFDYQFLSAAGSQGILTIFVDDQLVYKIDERIIVPGVNTAQDIPVGELNPGPHTIGFRLGPFTTVQSVARISNIALGATIVAPKIVRFETFREGVLVFFRLFFTDPSTTAVGFGFKGTNGSTWAEENHPFTSPSYGRVFPGIVEYPFNHLCGQPGQYESDVEAWIYDNAGRRTPSVTIHLACSAPGQ
jgi:hypothetical protein